jgi:hypothetical protein
MDRILHVSVSPKFGLDILVAQHPHFWRQVFPVRSEKPPV